MDTFNPSGGSKTFTPEPRKEKKPLDLPTFDAKKAKPVAGEGLIKAASFSALKDFEQCAYRAYLLRVKKVPTESSEPLERGNRVHDAVEKFIKGEADEISHEVKFFHSKIENLRKRYAEGSVMVEDEWAFDTEWEPTPWRSKEAWIRMKLDAMVTESETSVEITDWKTGKKFGNEFKHSEQGQLYAIGTFLLYPEVEHALVKFDYLDKNETLEKAYTKEETLLLFLPSWTKRFTRMTSATEFIPTPSFSNCRWCNAAEHCEWRVQ